MSTDDVKVTFAIDDQATPVFEDVRWAFEQMFNRSFLDDPRRRHTFNSTVRRPIDPARGRVYSWMAVTDELLIDAGYEPPAGYWARELEREIAWRSIRSRIRRATWPIRRAPGEASRRLAHAARALRGDECDR